METAGRVRLLVAAVLGWTTLAGLGAEPAPKLEGSLDSLKVVYEQATAKIESDYEQGVSALDTRYPQDLNALKARVQQAGDLNGVMAVDAEIRRFETERNIPDAAAPGMPDNLLALQVAQREARAALDRDRNTKTVALVKLYLRRLEEAKKSLTMAGKLDEALAVNAEIDRVKSNPAVMASDFAAAAADVPADQGASKAPAEPPAPAGPAVADIKLPSGVKMYEGGAPDVDGVTMKSESLTATSRSKLTRKLTATVSKGETGGPSRSSYSTGYSSVSSKSGSTTHYVRIGLRPASTQYRFAGGTLVVQYFAKEMGSQGKIEPKPAATQTIPLPGIEISKPITVDCAPLSLYSRSYKYKSYYGTKYSSESGVDLYGVVVSAFDTGGALVYQGASSTALDALGVESAPKKAGASVVNDGKSAVMGGYY